MDPARAISLWPWTLTPLTARVMAAILALGIAGVGAFAERRWSCVRVMLQVEAIMLALIAGAVVRGWSELHTGRVLTWLFGAGLLLVLAGSGAVAARRARRPGQVTA